MERVFETNFQHGDLVTTPLNLDPMPLLVLDRRAVVEQLVPSGGAARRTLDCWGYCFSVNGRCALSCCCATRAAIACSSPWLTSAERSTACGGRMT